ncbi:mRNA-decapping enzyme subunit 2 [Gurleya vavrai]
MNKAILDDISARFLICMPNEDKHFQERIFFLLEEAYWFYIDFYPNIDKLNMKMFCDKMLRHNNLKYNDEDFKEFQRYKKQVPVYGALIFNQFFDKILLVKGFYNDQFFFPKGKKNKDENPLDCATREVFEEIGYDIFYKIIDEPMSISEKFILFPVLNVNENTFFETRTRNEISEIEWFNIKDIESGKKDELKQVSNVFRFVRQTINDLQKNRFTFDYEKFNQIFESVELCN